MLGQSITRNGLLLGAFAVATTALIATTFLLTKDSIAAQKRVAEEKALLEIVPRSAHDNSMLDDTIIVGPQAKGLGLHDEKAIYLARQQGKVVAAIIPVIAPDGYTGDIEIIVGVNVDGTIAGARVLSHKETPGLGDQVDLKKSSWILGFNGRSLTNPEPEGWAVKRDKGVFDQFTGATITPRAVVAAIARALNYAQENHQRLYLSAPQAAAKSATNSPSTMAGRS